MVLRSVLLVIKQNTAKHHAAQSVKVKMALTKDFTQKQHTFGECTLYVFYCALFHLKILQNLSKIVNQGKAVRTRMF